MVEDILLFYWVTKKKKKLFIYLYYIFKSLFFIFYLIFIYFNLFLFQKKKENGKVFSTGCNQDGQLGLGDNKNRIEFTKINISEIIQISTGSKHSIFLNSKKKLFILIYFIYFIFYFI